MYNTKACKVCLKNKMHSKIGHYTLCDLEHYRVTESIVYCTQTERRPLSFTAELVSMGESARLAPSSTFYMVTSAILGCKIFKTGGNFWIILLKSCKSKDLTSFLD